MKDLERLDHDESSETINNQSSSPTSLVNKQSSSPTSLVIKQSDYAAIDSNKKRKFQWIN